MWCQIKCERNQFALQTNLIELTHKRTDLLSQNEKESWNNQKMQKRDQFNRRYKQKERCEKQNKQQPQKSATVDVR